MFSADDDAENDGCKCESFWNVVRKARHEDDDVYCSYAGTLINSYFAHY